MSAELGGTQDPAVLVLGRPGAVTATSRAWRAYGDALHQAGDGLRRLDTAEGWRGPAGDAFRATFRGQVGDWLTAGDAFHEAAAALDRYAATLSWAQGRAGDAIGQWDAGQAATRQAADQHVRDQQVVGHPLPFDDPGEAARESARNTLGDARAQLRSAATADSVSIGAARDRAPAAPGFRSDVGDVARTVGAGLADGAGAVGNAFASYGNAMLHHPGDVATMVAGAAVTVLGAGGELGGAALDLTGIGAVVGMPAGVVSAGVIATGVAMVAGSGENLSGHAAGDDAVEPFATDNVAAAPEGAYQPTEGFRGSEFSRDEIEQFINGHTGDRMPGWTRPTPHQISRILDEATPVQVEGQNAEQFTATVDGTEYRIIVNYDVPWRSTAFKTKE